MTLTSPHTWLFVDIFRTSVLQNLFKIFIFIRNITSDAPSELGGGGEGTSPKKGSNTLEVTSYIND